MNFADRKAELDDGVIRMLDSCTVRHCDVQANIACTLTARLHGTGWLAYGSALAIQTHDRSIRHPDVSVHDQRTERYEDDLLAVDRPCIVFEIVTDGRARTDLRTKFDEYRQMPSVETIVRVDIATERVRILQRTGPYAWTDIVYVDPTDIALPSIGTVLKHDKMFSGD